MATNIFQKGLQAFYEAEAHGGANGSSVSLVEDLSPYNRDLACASSKPTVKTGAVNGKRSFDWSGAQNPLSYTGQLTIRCGFLVVKADGNFTGGFQGILSSPANVGILTGIGGTDLFYDFNYPYYEFRLNDRIYPRPVDIFGEPGILVAPAPISTFGIIYFKFWTNLDLEGIQLGQDRTFADRKFNGEIAMLALYNRDFCEEEVRLMTRVIAYSYQLPLPDVFPYQGQKSDTVTTSKRILTDGQDDPVVRVKRGSRDQFDLSFVGRTQSEFKGAKKFWDDFYPLKSFLYRSYQVIPPEDTICRIPENTDFQMQGGQTVNDMGYKFAGFESIVAPAMTIPAAAPVIPLEDPDTPPYIAPPGHLLSIDVGRTSGGAIGVFEQDIFSGGSIFSYGGEANLTGEANAVPENIYRTIRFGTSFSGTVTALSPNTWYRIRCHFYLDAGTWQTVIAINGERHLHFSYPDGSGVGHGENRDIVARSNGSGQLVIDVIGEGAGTVPNTAILSAVQVLSTAYTTDSLAKQIICEGDSITEGAMVYLTSGTYPNQLGVLLGANVKQPNNTYSLTYDPTKSWLVRNVGYSGQTTSQFLSQAASEVDARYNGSLTENWAVLIGGTNDINTGVSAATIQSNIQTWCAGRRAAGFKVIIGTILPSTSFDAGEETIRTTVNSWIRANAASFADRIIDIASHANLDDASDLTYFSDGVHPTAAGYAIIAGYVKDAIEINNIGVIPGLVAWLKASDHSALSNGTGIAAWNSILPATINFAQSTSGNRPQKQTVSGVPVVRFTAASSHYMTAGDQGDILTNSVSILIVGKKTQLNGTFIAKSTSTAHGRYGWIYSSGNGVYGGFYQDSTTARQHTNSGNSVVDTDFHLYELFINRAAGNISLYKNTVLQESLAMTPDSATSINNAFSLNIGAYVIGLLNEYFGGEIKEINLIYAPTVILGTPRTRLQALHKAAYGLTGY